MLKYIHNLGKNLQTLAKAGRVKKHTIKLMRGIPHQEGWEV